NISDLIDYQSDLKSLERERQLNIQYVEGKAWEQLSFGISTRDGKPTLLENPILRQALASCIDREKIAGLRLDAGSVVDDFYLPGFRVGEQVASDYSYLPAESGLKIKELGWIDPDGDPATPRISEGVDGIPDGRVLQFTLLAAETDKPPEAVEIIQENLGSCGIGVEIQYLPASELLAPGPEGPVFGRDFDLAYFAWAAGSYQPCRLFLSDEIPGLYPEFPKGWGGVNAPGYSNEDFDHACRTVLTNLPDSAESLAALDEIQSIFRQELPALPLFFRQDVIIVHPDLAGVESGIFPLFWNIEGIEKIK
ncbi:MAG: ABC transporter substrate-binding protein, partial [Anaerolineales bacterium]|nr:ABC transporter substrate-binding protein [Anaerolineales bacterium]